jgi:hypothetical protein
MYRKWMEKIRTWYSIYRIYDSGQWQEEAKGSILDCGPWGHTGSCRWTITPRKNMVPASLEQSWKWKQHIFPGAAVLFTFSSVPHYTSSNNLDMCPLSCKEYVGIKQTGHLLKSTSLWSQAVTWREAALSSVAGSRAETSITRYIT